MKTITFTMQCGERVNTKEIEVANLGDMTDKVQTMAQMACSWEGVALTVSASWPFTNGEYMTVSYHAEPWEVTK